MSTTYAIIGRKRLTFAKLAGHVDLAWKQAHTGRITPIASRPQWLEAAKRDDSIFLATSRGGDVLHLNVSPAGNVLGFERYGGNDPSDILDLLDELGVEWLDEHDPEFDKRF